MFVLEQANNTQLRYLKREVARAKKDGRRKVAQVKRGVQAMIDLLPASQEALVSELTDLLALERAETHE